MRSNRHRHRDPAKYVSEDKALDYVAGYTIVNDVSERAFQLQSSQWDKARVPHFRSDRALVGDDRRNHHPQTLDVWLDVNGERRQSSNTKNMIFSAQDWCPT